MTQINIYDAFLIHQSKKYYISGRVVQYESSQQQLLGCTAWRKKEAVIRTQWLPLVEQNKERSILLYK